MLIMRFSNCHTVTEAVRGARGDYHEYLNLKDQGFNKVRFCLMIRFLLNFTTTTYSTYRLIMME